MSQIGTLVTGAGVTTVLSGRNQADEFIVIGDVDTANPLQSLVVEIDGAPFISILDNQALISAYAKWLTKWVDTIVGVVFKVATGVIRKNTTYRFTNAGATTPDIFAWSTNDQGVPFLASTKTINDSSYEDFINFSALFIGTVANLDRAEIVFRSGRKETLTPVELGSLYAMKYPSEANGYLAGVPVIDNTDQSIETVRLYTNGVGDNTILIAKIPDAAFKALRGKK